MFFFFFFNYSPFTSPKKDKGNICMDFFTFYKRFPLIFSFDPGSERNLQTWCLRCKLAVLTNSRDQRAPHGPRCSVLTSQPFSQAGGSGSTRGADPGRQSARSLRDHPRSCLLLGVQTWTNYLSPSFLTYKMGIISPS